MEKLIRLLVDAGADVNAKVGYTGPIKLDYRGHSDFTPLHNAIANENPIATKVLIELGADTNATNDAGEKPRDFFRFLDEQKK